MLGNPDFLNRAPCCKSVDLLLYMDQSSEVEVLLCKRATENHLVSLMNVVNYTGFLYYYNYYYYLLSLKSLQWPQELKYFEIV